MTPPAPALTPRQLIELLWGWRGIQRTEARLAAFDHCQADVPLACERTAIHLHQRHLREAFPAEFQAEREARR